MKTIAIDAIDVKSFGGLVHLQQLIKKLSRKNLYIKIFSNSFVEKKLNFKNNKKIKIIKNNLFDRNFILRHLWKIFFFEKELNKKKCKILLSLNGIYHGFYNPTILIQQNILPFDDYAKSKYSLLLKLKFLFQKLAILLSIKIHKHVIFTSFDTRKRILKYFKSKNLLNTNVIYHGASNKFVKNKFLFKKNLNLLFVSEFQKYKNHENLFHAIRKDEKGLIKLTCIGKYEISDLKILDTKYNLKKINVKVLSTISQKRLYKMYKYYDAIIFPTLCESFGLPMLEAAANKIPILCSDLDIFKEIYGNGCYYFDPKDPESILRKIYYFHSLKKKEILKKVNYNFTKSKSLNWNNFGKNYYDTIIKTINLHEKKN